MEFAAPKVIYHCHHGYPPSLRAASVHLHRPLATPGPGSEAPGRLRLVGRAATGEEVYTLARRGSGAIIGRALPSVARAFGVPEGGLAVVDATPWRDPQEAVNQALHLLRRDAVPRPIPRDEVWPKVIYVCYGSAHSSIVAANLHLGRLPEGRRASAVEVLAAPRFDELPHSQVGSLLEMGQDADGHRIYALGLGPSRDILGQAVVDLVASFGVQASSLLLVDALTGSHLTTRVGGFLSRRLGLVALGRPLAASGILADYDRFVRLVRGVRRRLQRHKPS